MFVGLICASSANANQLDFLRVVGSAPLHQSTPERLFNASTLCFKTGESSSGMTKICYYDCLGSPAAITIGSTQLCPLSIRN